MIFQTSPSYIEDNIKQEIDTDKVVAIAGCSLYHFQRVFSYMAGTTLSEYIRRRRLTLAAFELQSGEGKIVDVALKYGYESPTAFTRAFKQFHGMAPSDAKKSCDTGAAKADCDRMVAKFWL